MEIKKINIWSLVKVVVLIGLVFGIIFGVLTSWFLSSFAGNMASQLENPEIHAQIQQTGTDITQFSAILDTYKSLSKSVIYMIPIMSVISSAVFGFLIALLYNLSARFVGGIKIEFKEAKK